MSAVVSLANEVGVAAACRALRMPRSALYRNRASRRVCPLPAAVAAPRRRPPLALSEHEQRVVLDMLNSPRFVNCGPAAFHAQLLDEGRYIASVRTIVGFNGKAAGKFAPHFSAQGYRTLVLPSTSPAHASATLEQKLQLWQPLTDARSIIGTAGATVSR